MNPEDTCFRCGGSLEDGYQVRDYGVDPDTGYRDEIMMCCRCVDEEEGLDREDSMP